MSLTSYRAAPPRGKLGGQSGGLSKGVKKGQTILKIIVVARPNAKALRTLTGRCFEHILLADLATTYSPAP